MPECIVCARYLKYFNFDLVEFSAEFIGTFPKSIIGLHYFTQTEVQPHVRNVVPPTIFLGWMSRVKVDRLSHGSI